MKKAVSYLVLAILLVYFIGNSDFDFTVFTKAAPSKIILLFTFMTGSHFVTFTAVFVQMRMLNVEKCKGDALLLSMATNLLNYLPGKAGMLSLGTFLRTKKNVPLNKYAFTTVLFYLIVTIVTFIMSLFFLFDQNMKKVYSKIDFSMVTFFLLALVILSIIMFFIARIYKNNIIMRYYLLFINNRKMIMKNKMNVLFVSLIVVAGIALYSLRMYISFSISGIEITYYQAFMIGVIANLSFFLSFTPGGLGIKEGFVGGISYLLLGNVAVGVVASLIDRAANILVTVISGIIALSLLDKRYFSSMKSEDK